MQSCKHAAVHACNRGLHGPQQPWCVTRYGVIAYKTWLPAKAGDAGGLLDLGESVRDYAQVRQGLPCCPLSQLDICMVTASKTYGGHKFWNTNPSECAAGNLHSRWRLARDHLLYSLALSGSLLARGRRAQNAPSKFAAWSTPCSMTPKVHFH